MKAYIEIYNKISNKKEFTTSELKEETDISPATVRSYIHKLREGNVVEKIRKEGRTPIYILKNEATEEELSEVIFGDKRVKDEEERKGILERVKEFFGL